MLILFRVLPVAALLLVTAISTGKQQLALWLDTQSLLLADSELPTVEENLRGGSELVLSDGSHYLIAPSDRGHARLWITPIPIKVTPSGDNTYPLMLTNTLSGVAIKAKQLPKGETS